MADNQSNPEDDVLEPPETSPEQCRQKIAPWMATFADMVTLLMCFFILLFAMSTTQEETFKELIQSLRSALGVQEVPLTGTREALRMLDRPEEKKESHAVDEMGGMIKKEVDNIVADVKELIMFNTLQGMVNVKESDEGAIITISDTVLFNPGQADMSKKGYKILKKVSQVLSQFPYPIKIAGHTDNIPIKTTKYDSNWELSSARASKIVRYLISQKIDPTLLSAEGFAEFRPVTTNDTKKGRAKNRRIEFFRTK